MIHLETICKPIKKSKYFLKYLSFDNQIPEIMTKNANKILNLPNNEYNTFWDEIYQINYQKITLNRKI